MKCGASAAADTGGEICVTRCSCAIVPRVSFPVRHGFTRDFVRHLGREEREPLSSVVRRDYLTLVQAVPVFLVNTRRFPREILLRSFLICLINSAERFLPRQSAGVVWQRFTCRHYLSTLRREPPREHLSRLRVHWELCFGFLGVR